jgi:four helix bundle protein
VGQAGGVWSGIVNHEQLSLRLWHFAARVGRVVDALPDTRLGRHVAGQLVRCGTAGAPNYDEGCAAESRADFAHKLNIALKELVETRGWFRFIIMAELLPRKRTAELQDECDQLCRILGKSVATAKGRSGRAASSGQPETRRGN